MISDDHILFYFAGLVLGIPALIGIAYPILKALGADQPLLYSVIGTPIFIWLAGWIYSLVDDIDGHLD